MVRRLTSCYREYIDKNEWVDMQQWSQGSINLQLFSSGCVVFMDLCGEPNSSRAIVQGGLFSCGHIAERNLTHVEA